MFKPMHLLSIPAVLSLLLVGAASVAAPTALQPPDTVGGGPLINGDFQAIPLLSGWEVRTYGAPAEIRLDGAVLHLGRPSLRFRADEPSDTALGQEVRLRPGKWYMLTGWVRTRGLDPRGSGVYGTLQVQHPGGAGVITTGISHGGDTEWTPIQVPFAAPSDGRARIAVFFVGFGRGTGTAWFSDLNLKEVDPAMYPARITLRPLKSGRISPFQYGQFIEYLCNLVPGMWAEKLYDGSFEGLSPYDVVFRKETDFQENPWYPSGEVNRAEYSKDAQDPVSGAVSQKIAVEGSEPCTVGIAQDGIAVDRTVACDFSIYLRQEGVRGPVRVRLSDGRRILAQDLLHPDTAWRKLRARLHARASSTHATLCIEFQGPGTLYLDNASLMPENAIGGWRPDVVQALRALKPGIIRFGGSAVEYFNWRDTIGDPDHRRPFHAWGGLQPTGPGLEEIVQLIRNIGAEPLICVRFTGRTPEDAAAEVEYFNGAAGSPLGKLRAAGGHPEPYHIRYWQVGNEVQSADYDVQLAAFCRAMKAADPSIQLLSSFPTPGSLRNAGSLLDYTCPHQYDVADLAGTRAQLEAVRGMIAAESPAHQIKIAVTEWNTTAGDFGLGRAKLWTLANALACSRYQNLLHRECDLVEIANRSNLTNSFCSGILQTDNHRLYLTPTYYAQQVYASLAGDRPLVIESDLPPDMAPDMSATISPDGKSVTVFAVNDTLAPITRTLDISASGGGNRDVDVWTLGDRRHAGEPDATNSFDEPNRISVVRSRRRIRSGTIQYRFPPLSLTVLRWSVEQ